MSSPYDDLPGTSAVAITPSNTANINPPRAIYVGVGGNIAMVGANAPPGSAGVVWVGCVAGTILPFRPRQVLATGTTAASLLGIY